MRKKLTVMKLPPIPILYQADETTSSSTDEVTNSEDSSVFTDQDFQLAFLSACRRNRVSAVRELLSAGGETTIKARTERLGWTALHVAAAKNHIETCKVLLDRSKIKVDARDNNGNTALFLAVKNNNSIIVEFLLKHGADPNKVQQKKRKRQLACCDSPSGPCALTPFEWALENASTSLMVIKLLIRYGANVNGADPDGETPLIKALTVCQENRCSTLSPMGSPMATTVEKSYFATDERDDVEVVKLLLAHGADPHDCDRDAQTKHMYISLTEAC